MKVFNKILCIVAVLWAATIVLVGIAWTHESTYQEKQARPVHDARAQIVAACSAYLERSEK